MSRLFTAAALGRHSLAELRALHRQAQRALVQSSPGSQDRRAALANLETISLAIARKMAAPRP